MTSVYARSPSYMILVTDGPESVSKGDHAGDGSHECFVSAFFDERAVLNGIGKFEKIDKSLIQAALKNREKAHSFPFTRI